MLLVLYALPNGNTIEQTFDKRTREGEDWHYSIQHIGAQTRFLRERMRDRTVVVAYLQAMQRSWYAWIAGTGDSPRMLSGIVDHLLSMFEQWDTEIVLGSHSGGGRFIFSFIDYHDEIPGDIKRIAFLDSNYGYEDTLSGPKISDWLGSRDKKYLCVLAYNDSVVVSPK